MSKELKALERIKEFYPQWRLYSREDFKIIETALKREDSIEITAIDIEQDNKELCKENKKLKRVLEIIKLKQVNVCGFIQRNPKTFEEYQDIDDEIEQLSEVSLSQEEYELLKEVLSNE